MINARSHRTFAPVWLLLLLLLLIAGLGAAWLLKREIVGLDSALNDFLGPWRRAPLLDVFLWLTVLGSAPAVSVAVITATGFLGAAREFRTIVALWGAFAGSAATTWTIKYLVGRARPEFIDVAAGVSPSFPSAHSSSAVAVYGFLAVRATV